jgi:hypothetical protein
MRILELIAAVSASSRFLAFQHELMAYPDPKVRSKAALLAGRSAKSIASVGRLLRDEDAPVQANVDNPPTEVQAKGHHGFSSSPEQLAKVVSSGVSLAKGPSVLEGIEKAAQAISHLSGARHLFVFFHPASVDELVTEQRRVEQLAALLRDERIVLHGFAPSSSGDDRHFHELCGAMQGGNFEVCPVNAIPETLDRIFSQLLNRYEITYRLPQGDQPPNEGKLVLSSPQGCGHAPYALTPSVAITP